MKKLVMTLMLLASIVSIGAAHAGTVSGDLRFESVALGSSARTLRIYLPPAYASNTSKKFPVVYMFDGQNLFDTQTAAFGSEWRVDETMEQLVRDGLTSGAIVVGIDNEGTGKGRYEEYTNWDWTHPSIGFINARADETAAWLVERVIPFVNGRYRTLTGRSYTALAGSSMGAYMTIYTGLSYPAVFGKLAAFSTVALDYPMQGQNLRAYVEAARNDAQKSRYIASTVVYLDMGDQEQLSYTTSALLLDNHQQMCASFVRAGYTPTCRVIAGGVHNESAWATRVDDAFRVLSKMPDSFSKNWQRVYVRGTHNGWAATSTMTLVANNTWEQVLTFGSSANERFKFDLNGDWGSNFGDTNRDGVADAGGNDISIPAAGSYRIRINDSTRVYSVVRQ